MGLVWAWQERSCFITQASWRHRARRSWPAVSFMPPCSICLGFWRSWLPRRSNEVSGCHAAFQIVSHRKSSFAVLPFLSAGMLRGTMAVGVTAATLLTAGTAFTQVQTPAPGKRSEILRALPITKFYDTPHPLPAGKPGELIRSESFEEYELPLSVSAVRILYHSRSAAGEDVATSGVVLIPYGKNPPPGGWPVIAWAHGAT